MNDNETIKNKIKNNIRGLYLAMHNIAVNLADKENADKTEENNIIKDKNESEPEKEEEYDLERQIKIGNAKTKINEKINNITIDISKLHEEYNLKKYADI